MYKFLASSLLGLILFIACQPHKNEEPLNDFKVHAYYVIPSDKTFLDINANRVGGAIIEMQRWYQSATGGLTFELLDDEEIIEVYFAEHESSYYESDWWNLLLNEMKNNGHPIESSGTIAMIWVEGILQVSSDITAYGADMCGGNCGVAILPIATIVGPTWPPADMGVSLHEMGHTLGLTHPVEDDDLPIPTDEEPILYSVMCQEGIRKGTYNNEHGFLTSEKKILLSNPFLKKNILIYQDYWHVNIINYPIIGQIPEPAIEFEISGSTSVSFSSNINDALLYYWYFGDGSTSNDPNPTYEFGSSGVYNVTLMVTNNNYMAGRVSKYVEIP
jgi:hypothetical protein